MWSSRLVKNTPAYTVQPKFQINFEILSWACHLFDLVQGWRRGQTLISSGQGHEASALRRDCYRPQCQITFPSGHLDLSKEPHANYVERLVKERPWTCRYLQKQNFQSKHSIVRSEPTGVKTGLLEEKDFFFRNRVDYNFFLNARISTSKKEEPHSHPRRFR